MIQSVFMLALLLAVPAQDNAQTEDVRITPDVVYGHKAGLAMTFDVYTPQDDANGAGVLFMVSGGWYSKWGPPENAIGLFKPLTDKGFTVFAVRDGSSPKFGIPDAVADVRRSVRYIRLNADEYQIDPNRLGVYGMSAGGHLSLMLGTAADDGNAKAGDPVLKVSDRVNAVVAIVAPTDLRIMVSAAPDRLPAYKNFPALDLDLKAAEEYSPLVHVTPDDAPTLLIAGDQDKLVPIKHSETIHDAFKDKKVKTKFVPIEGAGHGFQGKDMQHAVEETVSWFELHLPQAGRRIASMATLAKNNSSYVSGACDRGMLGVTIGDLLDDIVARYPNNDALVVSHQNIRWTYKEFGERVDQLACGLLALGVEKKDRVGIWSANRAEWALVQFATAKIGAILVNINPAYRAAELEYALKQSGCRFLVMAERAKKSDFHAILQSIAPELACCPPRQLKAERLPELRTVVTLGEPQGGMLSWPQMLELVRAVDVNDVRARQRELSFDDPINIQYTSGTTGFPKGATLSHHNIVNNGLFVADIMRFTDQDRLVIPVPLYHCFGMVLGNLGCVSHGATMIYPSELFDPEAVLRAVATERATALYGVPTMFIAELGLPNFSDFDLTSLRTGIMAGALCPIEIMRRVKSEMHIEQIEIAYGMTETSPVSMQTRFGTPLEKQVSTVGQVHPHVEAKIVDMETGKLLPRGEKGEYCTRGYHVMLGYWNDPKATQSAIDEARWMHSGDLAVMDDEGYVEIVGRIKDMTIRGGENVYPREIETFLMGHPKIRDVYVIGIPDEKFGEEVVAWVQLQPGQSLTEEEVKSFCQERIAYFKIPKHVKFVDEFPMTVTGKVQKYKMREESIRELQHVSLK